MTITPVIMFVWPLQNASKGKVHPRILLLPFILLSNEHSMLIEYIHTPLKGTPTPTKHPHTCTHPAPAHIPHIPTGPMPIEIAYCMSTEPESPCTQSQRTHAHRDPMLAESPYPQSQRAHADKAHAHRTCIHISCPRSPQPMPIAYPSQANRTCMQGAQTRLGSPCLESPCPGRQSPESPKTHSLRACVHRAYAHRARQQMLTEAMHTEPMPHVHRTHMSRAKAHAQIPHPPFKCNELYFHLLQFIHVACIALYCRPISGIHVALDMYIWCALH